MARYKIGCVVVDPGGAGEGVIGQITNQAWSEGFERSLAGHSGGVWNDFATAAGRLAPSITFETRDIKTALGECGLTGRSLSADAGIALYLQQYSSEGMVVANGCKKVVIAAGMMLWRGINAPHGPFATATFEIIPISADGLATPFSFTDSQTLPAEGQAAEAYVCGGSGDLIQSWTLDTGLAVSLEYGDGKPWAQDVSLDAGQPRVDIELQNIADLGDTSIGSVVLTDCTAGGFRGSSPITFTFNHDSSRIDSIAGGGQVSNTISVLPLFDGTNLPIVISGLS